MIMVQKTYEVKERALPFLKWHLVNVTRPDKMVSQQLLGMNKDGLVAKIDKKYMSTQLRLSVSDKVHNKEGQEYYSFFKLFFL